MPNKVVISHDARPTCSMALSCSSDSAGRPDFSAATLQLVASSLGRHPPQAPAP